jgi:FADH2 O2-dependent halogenase
MREKISADIAIIGAGFGGSLTALLLNRVGFRVVLLDRSSHPRFAIGESSTPTADLVLRDLARRYDLPRILPLSKYGTWKTAYPGIVCGLKRGFSFFPHRPHEPFTPFADHRNELLVAASSEDLVADTHWLRADVDSFFAAEAQAAGVLSFDRTEIASIGIEEHSPNWFLTANREGTSIEIETRFLIDGTGEGGFLSRWLSLPSGADEMRTHSRGLFAHFENLTPWENILKANGADCGGHPFPCDRAAQHQLLEEGWMWQLRFDNGVTSAGFAIDTERLPLDPSISAEEEWDRMMARYPSLAEQFGPSRIVAPQGGLVRTGRLQRKTREVVNHNWALLPHTAGFVDPLYSSGIAQTMCGIERLVSILEHHWKKPSLLDELKRYGRTVQAEVDLIDQIVHGSYLALGNFELFVPFSMLYFAAATTFEHRRRDGQSKPEMAFLCAEDNGFRNLVNRLYKRLKTLVHQTGPNAAQDFFQEVADGIAPYNTVGLCDPTVHNMYRYTAIA